MNIRLVTMSEEALLKLKSDIILEIYYYTIIRTSVVMHLQDIGLLFLIKKYHIVR